jgi:hypothetical protein
LKKADFAFSGNSRAQAGHLCDDTVFLKSVHESHHQLVALARGARHTGCCNLANTTGMKGLERTLAQRWILNFCRRVAATRSRLCSIRDVSNRPAIVNVKEVSS